jgi:SAM-dependent methyltransferase
VTLLDPRSRFSAAWRSFRATTDLDEYDTRWERLAADGHDVHGEADLVLSFDPRSVLDAGCGTGRVAIELARRGVDVVGVDLDPDLVERARRRAPDLEWVVADLADVELGREFDVVVMAGNVLPFAEPGRRAAIVAAMARHLRPGGRLVTGATLTADWPTVDDHEGWCVAAGLVAEDVYAGWDRAEFVDRRWDPAGYVVTVHRRPSR